MIVYISGAITNCPNHIEKFKQAEESLKEQGYDVINPTMINLPAVCKHEDYMRVDFVLLDMAGSIYMLNNYEQSKGACMELGYAIAKGKGVMYQE